MKTSQFIRIIRGIIIHRVLMQRVVFMLLIHMTILSYGWSESEAKAINYPTVGAIRWNAWLPPSDIFGNQVTRSLSEPEFVHRVPFFTLIKDGKIEYPVPSQERLDKEIEFARYAGIDYWAYVYYENSGNAIGMDDDLKLHLTSAKKNLVKWCLIIENKMNETNMDDIVKLLGNKYSINGQDILIDKEDCYLINGKKVVYLYPDGNWNTPFNRVQLLRDKVKAAYNDTIKLYIVMMGGKEIAATAKGIGCDAISSYAFGGSNGETYQSLANRQKMEWDSWLGSTFAMPLILNVSTGWDPRPRIKNPVTWIPYIAENSWAETATPNEIVSHLDDAINWAYNHANSNIASILMYAWNEFDEGGWICPTLHTKLLNDGKFAYPDSGEDLFDVSRVNALHEYFYHKTGASNKTGSSNKFLNRILPILGSINSKN